MNTIENKPLRLTLTNVEKERRPYVLEEYETGFLLLADKQVVPGMCIFRPKFEVEEITDLTDEEYAAFTRDFRSALQHLREILDQDQDFLRLNWEKLGNAFHTLHIWIIPRYKSEGEENKMPIWSSNIKERFENANPPDEKLINKFKKKK
jgi:diadenosine tetraphosphate (Ap4A) HIT family hydrolase